MMSFTWPLLENSTGGETWRAQFEAELSWVGRHPERKFEMGTAVKGFNDDMQMKEAYRFGINGD